MLNNSVKNTITINDGIKIYYEIHGEGSPLLLLHGFTGSGANLLPLFRPLTRRHQLIIPDLRGHGRSTNPLNEFTHRQAASDIFSLLEHLKIDKYSAVGFSAGGNILLHMATQQPEKVQTLVLVSATTHFPKEARDIMRQFTIESRSEEEWTAMRKIHTYGDEQIRMLWKQAGDFSKSYDDLNFTHPSMSTISAKTLIVQGDRDPLYPVEISIEMYRSIPKAYLWIVPNGGHVPITEELKQSFINYLACFIE